jgi:hypothetical protein
VKALFALSFLWGLSGCADTCSTACAALLECGELDNASSSEATCQLDCAVQENAWEGTELEGTFSDYLSCVGESSCDELNEGVCYYESLYSF